MDEYIFIATVEGVIQQPVCKPASKEATIEKAIAWISDRDRMVPAEIRLELTQDDEWQDASGDTVVTICLVKEFEA